MFRIFCARMLRLGLCQHLRSHVVVTVPGRTAAERKMEARSHLGYKRRKISRGQPQEIFRWTGILAKKLGEMPLKWKNFFEVNRQVFRHQCGETTPPWSS